MFSLHTVRALGRRRADHIAGGRTLLSFVALSLLLGCGSGLGSLPTARSRELNGTVAFRPIPTSEALPSFAPLVTSFVAFEALLGGNQLVPMSPSAATSPLAASCSATGCPFVVANVDTSKAVRGAFALVAAANGAAASYVPTASMVLSPNQLYDNRGNEVGLSCQGHASLLTLAGVERLAKLANLRGEDLLARGFAIGVVVSSRSYPAGPLPGVARALVTLVDAASGAQVFYPNDTWDAEQQSGTNAGGAFVVVGPTAPATAGQALTVAINAPSALQHWPNQPVIVRPQLAIVMPMLPIP